MSAVKRAPAAVDANAEYFHYNPDITIDPPLSDAHVKAYSSEFLDLKQIKDEDVQLVNGEIKVVTNNVTAVKAKYERTQQCPGYSNFKRDVNVLFALVAKAGSKVTGHIVVASHDDGSTYWRFRADGDKAVVEAALLGWPDGTSSEFPGYGNA